MSLHKQFKSDEKKENEGIDITYGPNDDKTIPTFRILRRGPSNQRYVKTLENESKPYRRLLELGALDNKIQEKIMRRVFCSSILMGWENVQDEKGKIIPFNFENAVQLFEELPELYYDLSEQAGKLSSFRAETLESDAKN